MPERCTKITGSYGSILEGIIQRCDGTLIEVESKDDNGRQVVDFICKRCGDHTRAPLVVSASQASSMEDDDE